jgi:outer membrane immunogenic protein
MKKCIAAIAAAISIATTFSSFAADFAVRAPPPPVPVCTWCGFYIGGNVGYGWGDPGNVTQFATGTQNGVFADGPAQLAAELAGINNFVTTNPRGVLGGIQIGYNQQINRFVWGFEADYAWANINGSGARISPIPVAGTVDVTTTTNAVNQNLDGIGTVRGRFGFLPTENFLTYVTGGFAYGRASSSSAISMVHTVGGVVAGDTFTPTAGAASKTLTGWTVGAGGEWMFAPHWSVKGEWLWYDLGDLNYPTGTITGIAGANRLPFTSVNVASSTHFAGSIARVGINYQFGAW